MLRFLVRFLARRPLEVAMSLWTDAIDWLGGYPFEVATPEHVLRFFRDLGFTLIELRTCRGRMGVQRIRVHPNMSGRVERLRRVLRSRR